MFSSMIDFCFSSYDRLFLESCFFICFSYFFLVDSLDFFTCYSSSTIFKTVYFSYSHSLWWISSENHNISFEYASSLTFSAWWLLMLLFTLLCGMRQSSTPFNLTNTLSPAFFFLFIFSPFLLGFFIFLLASWWIAFRKHDFYFFLPSWWITSLFSRSTVCANLLSSFGATML